jgi:phosphatidylinositol kinase/protein kinase (PI-3  family)
MQSRISTLHSAHRARFQPGKSEGEASAYVKSRINKSYLSFRSVAYDHLQFVQNGIPY